MLEEGGYLTSEEVDGKRVYTITESGRQAIATSNLIQETPTVLWESLLN